MKITLSGKDSLRVEDTAGPLTVEAPTADVEYSPFAMMASGLGVCTLSTLHSWAEQAKLATDGLAIEVAWRFAEKPHRVDRFAVAIHWPGLDPKRVAAAARAAKQCTVHHTLEQPPEIAIDVVDAGSPAPAAEADRTPPAAVPSPS